VQENHVRLVVQEYSDSGRSDLSQLSRETVGVLQVLLRQQRSWMNRQPYKLPAGGSPSLYKKELIA
jgi:hypothetical protein